MHGGQASARVERRRRRTIAHGAPHLCILVIHSLLGADLVRVPARNTGQKRSPWLIFQEQLYWAMPYSLTRMSYFSQKKYSSVKDDKAVFLFIECIQQCEGAGWQERSPCPRQGPRICGPETSSCGCQAVPPPVTHTPSVTLLAVMLLYMAPSPCNMWLCPEHRDALRMWKLSSQAQRLICILGL